MSVQAANAVEIAGLWTSIGGGSALVDVSLTVHQHEILGVVGRRGAGKTSLLEAALMLATPDAGTVRIFGEPHYAARARAQLAYLPQRFSPPGHLSGHDFVRMTQAFHGRQAKRARTAILAAQIELDPGLLNRPIRSYSKGMAQKLGLLTALLTDRPLLVLDEPLAGLDPAARRLLKRQLAAYRARGRTILLSSPIPSDHEALCDRVAVLHRGRLRYVGAPGDLQARHRASTLTTAFLAEIGSAPAGARVPVSRSGSPARPDRAGA
jgi:ABC-2 type transport system ATP-binding protein